jgi:hypothetical protein
MPVILIFFLSFRTGKINHPFQRYESKKTRRCNWLIKSGWFDRITWNPGNLIWAILDFFLTYIYFNYLINSKNIILIYKYLVSHFIFYRLQLIYCFFNFSIYIYSLHSYGLFYRFSMWDNYTIVHILYFMLHIYLL